MTNARPLGVFGGSSEAAETRARHNAKRSAWRQRPDLSLIGNRAAQLGAQYPDAPPGVVMSIAKMTALPLEHPRVAEVMQQAVVYEESPATSKGVMGRIGDVVGGIAGGLGNAATAAVRTGMTVAQTPFEELQGIIRAGGYAGVRLKNGEGNFGRDFWEVFSTSGSTGRLALGDLLTGDKVDLGEGFFAGGDVARKQEALANRHVIDGNAISVGRVAAGRITTQGTTSYNIVSGLLDGALMLAADPVAIGATKLTHLRKGAGVREGQGIAGGRFLTGRSFSEIPDETMMGRAAERVGRKFLPWEAGGAKGNAKDVQARRFSNWANTQDDLWAHLAEDMDGESIYNFLRRKISLPDAYAMAGKTDPNEMRKYVEGLVLGSADDGLGPTLAHKLRGGGGTLFGRAVNPHLLRLVDLMPDTHLQFFEEGDQLAKHEAMEQARRWMVNAKIDPEERSRVLGRMNEVTLNSQMYDVVVTDMLDSVARPAFIEAGLSEKKARQLTSSFVKDLDDRRIYAVGEVVEDAAVLDVVVDGDLKQLMSPALHTQLLNSGIPLPNPQEIRRSMSSLARLMKQTEGNDLLEIGESALSSFQENIWKPTVLLRGAWTVRVVGEEQIRMAASGAHSLFSHPFSALAIATGKKLQLDANGEFFERRTQRVFGLDFNRADAAFKDLADEDVQDLMSKTFASKDEAFRAVNELVGDEKTAKRISRTRDRWKVEGEEDSLFNSKKEARNYAATLLGDEFAAAKSRGSMGFRYARHHGRDAKVIGRSDENYAQALTDELAMLSNDGVARRVVAAERHGGLEAVKDWFWNESEELGEMKRAIPALQTRWGADTYIDWVGEFIEDRTGGLDELRALLRKAPSAANTAVYDEILDTVSRMDPELLPTQTVFHRNISDGTMAAMDKALETMFNTLMSRPTNFLSRSPFFKQTYWTRMEQVIGFGDAAAQKAILENAEKANVGDAALARMRKNMGSAPGEIELSNLDTIVKGHALDETRKLLYDLNKRTQVFDMLRLVTPFGEAWKEVTTTWARIGTENVAVPRRLQQIVGGARGAEVPGLGQGFFSTDENGQETYISPTSSALASALMGRPIAMRSPVAGLNIIGQVMPGVGPVVQYPAAALLSDNPDFDWVENAISPFGEPEAGLAGITPAWLKKAQVAGVFDRVPFLERSAEQQALYMNSVKETMQALSATGEYDLVGDNGAEEGQRLLEDAQSQAKKLWLVRSLAQFVEPAAPRPDQLVEDKDGKLVSLQALTQLYRSYRDEDPETAASRFLKDLGPNAFPLMESKTAGVFLATEKTDKWARDNPDIREDYKRVYGFFAPQELGEKKFDYNAHLDQIARGERDVSTPDEWLGAAQHRVARLVMKNAREQMPNAGPGVFGKIEDDLVSRLPGFQPQDFSSDLQGTIGDLKRAVLDERLADSREAQPIRQYLAVREAALQEARARGRADFTSSDDTEDIRMMLQSIAVRLMAKDPGFAEVWQKVFLYEVRTNQ